VGSELFEASKYKEKEMKMKLGMVSYSFLKVPLEEALPQLAEIGYEAVEILTWENSHANPDQLSITQRKEIKKNCDTLGLEISALAAHHKGYADTQQIYCENEKNKETLNYLYGCLGLANQWEVDVLTTASGPVPKGMSEEETWKRLEEMVNLLLKRAKKDGVKIAWEAHFLPGELVKTPDDLRRLLKMIDDPYLRVNMDCAHYVQADYDPIKEAEILLKYTIHTHLKGMKGKKEAIPGPNDDFPTEAWIKLLKDNGYEGVVSVEIPPEICNFPEGAERAYSYLSQLI